MAPHYCVVVVQRRSRLLCNSGHGGQPGDATHRVWTGCAARHAALCRVPTSSQCTTSVAFATLCVIYTQRYVYMHTIAPCSGTVCLSAVRTIDVPLSRRIPAAAIATANPAGPRPLLLKSSSSSLHALLPYSAAPGSAAVLHPCVYCTCTSHTASIFVIICKPQKGCLPTVHAIRPSLVLHAAGQRPPHASAAGEAAVRHRRVPAKRAQRAARVV